MVRLQPEGAVEISPPAVECLAGQAGDQIKVDVLKSGFAQMGKRRADIL